MPRDWIPGGNKFLGLIVAFIVLIVIGVLNQRSTSRFVTAVEERAAARDVLLELNALFSALQDAETGQRGYLLTGDDRYLAPYHRARKDINISLQRIRRLDALTPQTAVDLPNLTPLIEEKLSELQETIEIRNTEGIDAAIGAVRTDRGKRAMDGIRRIIAQQSEIFGGITERRTQLAEKNARDAQTTFLIGGLASISLLLVTFAWLVKETRNSQAAADRVREMNQSLERRVQNRTEQLSRSNEALLEEAQERRHAEGRYTLLVEAVKDYAIFMLDPAGRVSTWNEGAERMKGYKEEEILGKNFSVFYTEEERRRGRPQHTLEMATKDGTYEEIDLRQRKDGSQFWADVVVTALHDDEGHLLGFTKISRDITERRKAEESLREAKETLELKVAERTQELTRANAKLQDLDRLKSEFLATMSHELRTPLNSIIGFTGIIKQGLAGPVNEEQAKQLSMVYTSAKHLLNLINDLLDLSRIESGKMDVVEEEFEIETVINEVVDTLHPIAMMKGLGIEKELKVSGRIRTDRKKFFQILLNLTNNAVKFTERGHVKILGEKRDGELLMTVEDTGIGIKPEQLTMLFEAFRQVEGSATRNYEGTGLGLYLCKKLVRLLGGDIWVKTQYGEGSSFSFRIPLREGGRP